MKDKALIEAYTCQPARIDAEQGILHDCLLLGETSKNGTLYPSATREAALPLFEGMRINLDHPSQRGEAGVVAPTSWDRRYGKTINVRNAPDGIRGDVKVLKRHPFTPTLLEAAVEMPEMFGFSPRMFGLCTPRDAQGVEVCTKIRYLRSIDIVTDPGTTKSLFEDHQMDEAAASPETHEAEVAEGQEIEQELQHLIEQITTELVDFHHDHKDVGLAKSRIGEHLKHHAKMHLGKEEEEPKEEAKEEKETEKEEHWLPQASAYDRALLEESQPQFKVQKPRSGYQPAAAQTQDWNQFLRSAK